MIVPKLKTIKRKSVICLLLTFLIIFSVFSSATRLINAASAPVLSIVPTGIGGATSGTTTMIQSEAVGSNFSVDVRVDNYASVNIGGKNNGVSGASYFVTWNPAVLGLVSYTDEKWLPSQSSTGDFSGNVTLGQLLIGQIAFDLSSPFLTANSTSGSVSVTIKFEVLSTGSTLISLSPQKGVAYLLAPQTAGDGITAGYAVSGTLTANAQYGPSSGLSSPSLYGPTAVFTPMDGSAFKLGTPITLNATLSTPGNDTQICDITNYAWSVEYLNGTTLTSLTGEATTFTPDALGSFRVILIVTAPDVSPSPNPDYSSTDSTSAIINVISSALSIDVFTDKEGIGQGASEGAYGPLQLVPTYALVTTSDTPLADQSVFFTILDANGTSYYRQGVTNETGIATIQPSFRLPAPDFGSPQTGFGTWSITATTSVLNVIANDTTTFTFNYLSGIENITLPTSIHATETLPIQLTINNIALSEQWTQLSITIFDQAGIPIGSSTLTATQQTQDLTVVDAAITIPSWAFTGQATVYLCLISNSTNIPLAPESIANFNILS